MPRKPRHLLCGIVIELGTRNCVLEALVSLNLCVCVGKVDKDCGVAAGSTLPLHLLWPGTSQLSVGLAAHATMLCLECLPSCSCVTSQNCGTSGSLPFSAHVPTNETHRLVVPPCLSCSLLKTCRQGEAPQ